MAARTSAFVLTFVILFTINCKDREEQYLKDGNLNFVLYVDPSSDCPDCVMNAMKILSKYISRDQKIYIYLQKSKDNERFKLFLKDSFKERELSFYVVDLKVPHPSILLVKGKSIYMHLYIPNDPFLLNEVLQLCRDFFLINFDQ